MSSGWGFFPKCENKHESDYLDNAGVYTEASAAAKTQSPTNLKCDDSLQITGPAKREALEQPLEYIPLFQTRYWQKTEWRRDASFLNMPSFRLFLMYF